MDHLEELRRVLSGYRRTPPLASPAALLTHVDKLDAELGPSKHPRAHLPAGGNLESDLHDVAKTLLQQGGVSHVAGTLLRGVLAELATPGRPSTGPSTVRPQFPQKDDVIRAQPNHAGQIPELSTGTFPSPN